MPKAVFLALADDLLERGKIGEPCASVATSSASMMHDGRAAKSAARRGKRSVQSWPFRVKMVTLRPASWTCIR